MRLAVTVAVPVDATVRVQAKEAVHMTVVVTVIVERGNGKVSVRGAGGSGMNGVCV